MTVQLHFIAPFIVPKYVCRVILGYYSQISMGYTEDTCREENGRKVKWNMTSTTKTSPWLPFPSILRLSMMSFA